MAVANGAYTPFDCAPDAHTDISTIGGSTVVRDRIDAIMASIRDL
jgi:heptaprenylglyceryl phosphate synthase